MRSEARAFRFVFVVVAGVAAVTLADLLAAPAVLVVVFALAIVGVAGAYLLGGPQAQTIPAAAAHVGTRTERRALLLVDEHSRDVNLSGVREQPDRVLVVALTGPSPLQHFLSDLDPARARARRRMEDAVSCLRALELDASGVIGEEDPFSAIDDALRTFGGDEIVVASADAELIGRLRDRYAIPVSPAAAT